VRADDLKAEIVPKVGQAMVYRQPDWVLARVVDFSEKDAVRGGKKYGCSS